MSGQRISKSERSVIKSQRRYVRQIRENEYATYGNNVESSKSVRAFARIGK